MGQSFSSYFYLKNGGMNKMDNDWALENIKQYETFQEFVLRWVNKKILIVGFILNHKIIGFVMT